MKKLLTLALSAAVLFSAVAGTVVTAQDEHGPLTALDSSTIVLDRESMAVTRVCGIPTAAELKAQFANDPADLTVLASDGSTLADGDGVPHGSALVCRSVTGEETFSCVITGDANPDAKLNMKDVSRMIRSFAGYFELDKSGVIDVNCDGANNMKDVSAMLRYLAGWDVTVGVENIVYTEEEQLARAENPDIILCFGNDLDKLDGNRMQNTGKHTDTILTAKNEISFTQMFLSCRYDVDGLSISVTPFTSQKGETLRTEILSEYYFDVTDPAINQEVSYADALPPVESEFSLTGGRSQGFVIKAFTDADSASGLYRATVTVKQGQDTVKKAYVYTKVWNFVLSDESACATAFGMSRWNIYTYHGQYESDDGVLYKAYYDFLIENRISPYYLPYNVLDDEADEYMSNPRVTSFMIDGRNTPNGEMTDEDLEAAYAKLSANEEWMKKGYFYYEDEPMTAAGVDGVRDSALRLQEHFPDYRLIVPSCTNELDGMDLTALLADYVNLWCPLTDFWTSTDCTVPGASIKFDDEAVALYGDAQTRFANEVAGGDELWWYVCYWPLYPYPNFLSTHQGTLARVVFWQTYMYDVKGLLYWTVTEWYSGREWRTMDVAQPYGDGRLIYCGSKYNIRGPISTIRLEQVRDGIEDYQYMAMIEELYGSEKVDELIAKVTTDVLDYTDDSEVLRSVRNEMGELIEAYYNK